MLDSNRMRKEGHVMPDLRARMLAVGSRIRSERIRRDWSQKILASRLRTSKPQISQWENSRKIPTPHSLYMIARALDVPVDTLLGDLTDLSGYDFGQRLKILRYAKGMTLQDISRFLECSHVTVSLWEMGAMEPKASDVGKVAAALDVTCDFLILGRN